MDPADAHRPLTEDEFLTEAMRWLPNVARYARLLARDRADADDLTQETFLRAQLNWTTFRPGTDCRKWLFAICRHLFLRTRQRESRMVGVEDPEVDVRQTAELYWEAAANGLSRIFDRIDLGPALERGLCAMPTEYREVIMLVDIEDYTYADAAQVLDVPVGTVRSRLFRGRRLLQQTLIEYARDRGFAVAREPRTMDERALT